MNVLVVAPHPDDEAIGCGGAVLKHGRAGDRVVVAVLTSGERGLKHLAREEAWAVREAESVGAGAVLGTGATHFFRLPDCGLEDVVARAAGALAPLLARELPAVMYLPHEGDDHPDHRACTPIVRGALAAASIPAPELRGYEVWSPLGAVDHLEDITGVMEEKLRAIRAFQSQLAQLRYDLGAQGLNQYRGALSMKYRYAEAFTLARV